ncbi:type I DNA topoisomerase [Patescibacteria group bacterium]|nr:type I DNA topoisomerase [Patescibacteria group bacterium]
MKLLIVESPSKAKTIEKYLDGAYTVRASVGHIRDLPKSQKKAIDIEGGFIAHYEISKGKEKVVDELRALAAKATEIVLAPDPDREGEAIAWHIEELLKADKKVKSPITRVTFNEITKDAILTALEHPRAVDTNLRRAQEARRVLDRLVGYDLSGIIWQKVRYGLSAGRVQSPALRILVEREREIKAFIPEDYWVLSALVRTQGKAEITLNCVEEPRDKKEVDRIITIANKESWVVKDVKESEQKRSPKAPFTTSTLQQAASSRLSFSPSRTMQVAQKLYEAGHITYMRTDSTTISAAAIPAISTLIEKRLGKEYLEVRTYKTKSKNAQEAHEAVRPTHVEKESVGNTEEQKKLYRLIWERTVASQMADAKVLKTRIVGNVVSDSIPDFTVTGSQVLFPGWLSIDTAARGDDVELPAITKGEALTLITLTDTAKQTEPPNRYSEAGLVKELESRGIGRPSTYAAIISTLEIRGYIEKINRSLKPTDTGEVVSTFLEDNFMEYINDTFTAEMEDKLDDIAAGEREYKKVLTDFYKPFQKDVKEKMKLDKATTLGIADPQYKCPKCGSGMIIKLGRGGKFLSCDTYPDCDGALTIDGLEIKKDEPIGVDPETELPIFTMIGRFGPYVQLGAMPPKVKGKKAVKPKMASIPREVDPTTVTLAMALKYLSVPRNLGEHPVTGLEVSANNGRFGPYVAHDGNFRSIKKPLDVYTITFEQALELLAQEKKPRGFQKKIPIEPLKAKKTKEK